MCSLAIFEVLVDFFLSLQFPIFLCDLDKSDELAAAEICWKTWLAGNLKIRRVFR